MLLKRCHFGEYEDEDEEVVDKKRGKTEQMCYADSVSKQVRYGMEHIFESMYQCNAAAALH